VKFLPTRWVPVIFPYRVIPHVCCQTPIHRFTDSPNSRIPTASQNRSATHRPPIRYTICIYAYPTPPGTLTTRIHSSLHYNCYFTATAASPQLISVEFHRVGIQTDFQLLGILSNPSPCRHGAVNQPHARPKTVMGRMTVIRR
jgi:hypothetical protein